MRALANVCLLMGFLVIAFALWGTFTIGGQSRFDEMDGLYPYFAGLAGACLFVVGISLAAFASWTKRRQTTRHS
jgi:hypothetical protein